MRTVVPEELNPVAVLSVRDMATGRELGYPRRIEDEAEILCVEREYIADGGGGMPPRFF